MPIEEFQLTFKEEPFKLVDPKTKVTKLYLIKEFDGAMRDIYHEKMSHRFEMTPDGKVGKIKNVKGLESSLLGLVLFEVKSNWTEEDGKLILSDPVVTEPVTEKLIDSWPSTLRTALHDKARLICSLDEDAETTAKND